MAAISRPTNALGSRPEKRVLWGAKFRSLAPRTLCGKSTATITSINGREYYKNIFPSRFSHRNRELYIDVYLNYMNNEATDTILTTDILSFNYKLAKGGFFFFFFFPSILLEISYIRLVRNSSISNRF